MPRLPGIQDRHEPSDEQVAVVSVGRAFLVQLLARIDAVTPARSVNRSDYLVDADDLKALADSAVIIQQHLDSQERE